MSDTEEELSPTWWWMLAKLHGTNETRTCRVIVQLVAKKADAPKVAWNVALAFVEVADLFVEVADLPPESIIQVTEPERPCDRLMRTKDGTFPIWIEEGPQVQELIKLALEFKLSAIARYEEISWKVRSGYIVILYGALTFLLGKELADLKVLVADITTSASVGFIIVGLSVSAFAVDYGFLKKRIRVVVVRDRLVEVEFDRASPKRKNLLLLLHIAAERPFKKTQLQDAQKVYDSKRRWNLLNILLPIYATTPVLAVLVYWWHSLRCP